MAVVSMLSITRLTLWLRLLQIFLWGMTNHQTCESMILLLVLEPC